MNNIKENISRELYKISNKSFLTIKETAEVLGVSVDWVRSVLKQANIKLRHKELLSLSTIADALIKVQKYPVRRAVKSETNTKEIVVFCDTTILLNITEICRIMNISRERAKDLVANQPYFAISDQYGSSQRKFYYFENVAKFVRSSNSTQS